MTADWLVRLAPVPPAPRLRLLCLPFAGGGPLAFRSWAAALPAGVELLVAQLPGRERRLGEAPCSDIGTITEALCAAIPARPEAPLALFGHSMGGALAHDLAVALTRAGHPPAVVAVAGRQAPHLVHRRRPLHRLTDVALLATLAEMGGTPAEVLGNSELMALMLPALRADILLAESFLRPAGPAFSCPVLALAGRDDPFAPPSDVQAWQSVTTGRFRFECFDGGHFFTTRHRDTILAMIVDEAMAGVGSETLRCFIRWIEVE